MRKIYSIVRADGLIVESYSPAHADTAQYTAQAMNDLADLLGGQRVAVHEVFCYPGEVEVIA